MLISALILGLLGSLHCAGMCGPLALALPQTSGSGVSYLTGRVCYNVGRVVTYVVLGLLFGLVGQTFVVAGVQQWASIALGAVLLCGLAASKRLAVAQPVTRVLQIIKTRMGRLLKERSILALGTLGALNGLLPCGLVYVACAGATASGSMLSGAEYMLVFGLGTVPMMLGISLSGRLVPVTLRLRLRSLIPVSVFMLGSLLILRGMALGIPYVSPSAPASGDGGALVAPACCHK